jgi:integrase/recombinase XerD
MVHFRRLRECYHNFGFVHPSESLDFVMPLIDHEKLGAFREFLGERGRQIATIESYGRDLLNFLQFLEAENIDSDSLGLDTLESFKSWQSEQGSKASSIRRSVIALRMFFRWLEESGQLHGNPFDDAPVPAHEYNSARNISLEKIDSLIAIAKSGESSLKSARDVALLLLLAKEGLKASEIVQLHWNHFLAPGATGRLNIPGEKSRTIGLETATSDALKDYRISLAQDPRTGPQLSGVSPLFVSFKGADARSVQFGITRHGLKFAIYELGAAANIHQLNAEQLRHVAMAHKLTSGFTPDLLMHHLGLRRIGNIGKHMTTQSSCDMPPQMDRPQSH